MLRHQGRNDRKKLSKYFGSVLGVDAGAVSTLSSAYMFVEQRYRSGCRLSHRTVVLHRNAQQTREGKAKLDKLERVTGDAQVIVRIAQRRIALFEQVGKPPVLHQLQ